MKEKSSPFADEDEVSHFSYGDIIRLRLGWDESDSKELSHMCDNILIKVRKSEFYFSGDKFQEQEKMASVSLWFQTGLNQV